MTLRCLFLFSWQMCDKNVFITAICEHNAKLEMSRSLHRTTNEKSWLYINALYTLRLTLYHLKFVAASLLLGATNLLAKCKYDDLSRRAEWRGERRRRIERGRERERETKRKMKLLISIKTLPVTENKTTTNWIIGWNLINWKTFNRWFK